MGIRLAKYLKFLWVPSLPLIKFYNHIIFFIIKVGSKDPLSFAVDPPLGLRINLILCYQGANYIYKGCMLVQIHNRCLRRVNFTRINIEPKV